MSSRESTKWNATAEVYSASVGRMSFNEGRVIVDMADKLSPISRSSHIIDVGAGTGAVTLAIRDRFPGTSVLVTDAAEAMLDQFKRDNEGLKVQTRVVDATRLQDDLGSEKFTHVFSNFMLQAIPFDTVSIIRQMYEILSPGGVAAIGIWGPRADPYVIVEKACRSIDPTYIMPAPLQDPGAWRTEEDLRAGMRNAGFTDITVATRTIHFPWESAQAYTDFWFNGVNPGATKIVDSWKGDKEGLRRAMVALIDAEYGGGSDIYVSSVLGVGSRSK